MREQSSSDYVLFDGLSSVDFTPTVAASGDEMQEGMEGSIAEVNVAQIAVQAERLSGRHGSLSVGGDEAA